MATASAIAIEQLTIANELGIAGGRFSIGVPWADFARSRDWLGESVCWIPDDCNGVQGPVYSLASSRLGRYPHCRPQWFAMLRHAIFEARRAGATMLVCDHCAAAPWVMYAAQRLQCPSIRISACSWDHESFATWLDDVARHPIDDAICIGPPIEPSNHLQSVARRDAAAIGLADRLYVPWVRRGGNVDRLLDQRLADDRFEAASTLVAIDTSQAHRAEKLQRGAIGWFTVNDLDCAGPLETDGIVNTELASRITSLDELLTQRGQTSDARDWPYLVHCTRQRSGPWPDQSDDDYRHELLMSTEKPVGTPWDTLRRIADMQRLVATNRINRGNDHVVCFSGLPLSQLLHHRRYRSHLGRWDYEPFGVAILRDRLAGVGAKPVIYGDDATYETLDESERAFFQHQGRSHDWTFEVEWRVADNVALDRFDPGDGFLFVPSVEDAVRLDAAMNPAGAQFPRMKDWPIVVTS